MTKLTDNSFFNDKVQLRIDNLPDADIVKVFDVYRGSGKIWDEIIQRTGRKINVLGIEKKHGMKGIYLQGDNRKFRLDYNEFDLIDLDAYGVPFDHLERIFRQANHPIGIFVTFIQSILAACLSAFCTSLAIPGRW